MPAWAVRDLLDRGEQGVIATVGKYQLLRKLGAGGMAEIYLARSATGDMFEKLLVIKSILPHLNADDAFITMFLDEARISASLQHANIVQVFDFGRADDRYYLAMEYVQGRTVHEMLKKLRGLQKHTPPEVVVHVGIEICRALDYAHRKRDHDGRAMNIVHRDVSPSNILVSIEGEVKLLDFGIAAAAGKQATTDAGTVKGKFRYMAPELIEGLPPHPQWDIFALGVTLYEMLALAPLFSASTPQETFRQIRQGELPSMHDLPGMTPALEQVLKKALARDAAQRYQTCRELQAGLEQVARGLPPPRTGDFVRSLFHHELLEDEAADRLQVTHARQTDPSLRLPALAPRATPLPPAELDIATGSSISLASERRRRGAAIAAISAVALGALAWLGATQLTSRRTDPLDAVRAQLQAGRLIAPAGTCAFDLFVTARRAAPDATGLAELGVQLAAALDDQARSEDQAGRYESAAALYERELALGHPSTKLESALALARKGAVAVDAGMVRAGDAWVDRYEYPNRKGALPLTQIDWQAAADLCQARGQRLCTESEWERACAGEAHLAFPYGPEFQPGRCVAQAGQKAPQLAGSLPSCMSPEGAIDLSGNVAEWTSSPVAPGAAQRVVRGGFWSQTGEKVSCSTRDYLMPGLGGARHVGFRCCL